MCDLSGAYSLSLKNTTKTFFLSCQESRMENPRSFYGCFYVGPFYSSQALTVANALRRTLLSEISGLAITTVEIQGVTHEYSTLPGMKESVLDLLLNLKEIIFKKCGPLKNPQLGYLQAKGPGVIRALDLKMPSFLQCVDPNQYIATLTEDGFLNFKFQLEEGKNNHQTTNFNQPSPLSPFSLNSESFPAKIPLTKKKENFFLKSQGEASVNSETAFWESVPLQLEAFFNPISQVNYAIRPYGPLYASTRKQIIVFEIWTNGSILPRQAVYEGFHSLILLFSQLEKMRIFQTLLLTFAASDQTHYNRLVQKMEETYKPDFSTLSKSMSTISETALSSKLVLDEKIFTENFSSVSLIPKTKPSYQKKEKKNLDSSFLSISSKLKSQAKSSASVFSPKNSKKQENVEFLKQQITSLPISKRSQTLLKKNGILTIENLLNYKKEELLMRPGFGKKSLEEIQTILQQYEMSLL
jgi:DNA-directed RNA polymerase subunit alpha